MNLIIRIIIVFSFYSSCRVLAINQVLNDYLNTFKLTNDIELAKNTPLDHQLHFITPKISNFKNEILEETYFVLSKDLAQYDFIQPFQTVFTMPKCSTLQSDSSSYSCVLISYNSSQFNFTKEKLIIFGQFETFKPIDSLSNFKCGVLLT